MRAFQVGENEAGQRLDKYLKKLLGKAPDAFLYKMLRKKNITLNGKKAAGAEKLKLGDEVSLYLSEETIEKFLSELPRQGGEVRGRQGLAALSVLYEDDHVLAMDKPAGVLSQPDKSGRPSMGEYVTSYLLSKGVLTREDLLTFHPGVCNRLDYMTTGVLLAGKSLAGLQGLSALLKDRRVQKEYLAIVKGEVLEPGDLLGYLQKDEKCNKVRVLSRPEPGAQVVHTSYTPLYAGNGASLLLVQLHTGKSHQIRAHLSFVQHPLLGDQKYGGGGRGLTRPMLHAYRLRFPLLPESDPLRGLSGRVVQAPVPEDFRRALREVFGEEALIQTL